MRIHLDTDFAGDPDDACALAMVLGWPGADVLGVTTTADPDGSRAAYLAELSIRHIRTQIDTPWTNGKIESFWATLQAEVLDRHHLADLAAADAAVSTYSGYHNYHRLHGELGWRTPPERFDGTPFTDRGFEHVPALAGVADHLADLMAVA